MYYWVTLKTAGVGVLGAFDHIFSVAKSCPTLQPHGLQRSRLPCPSPSPGVCSNACPLSRWCHLTLSSSVGRFSCLQSFPPSGSFPRSHRGGNIWKKQMTIQGFASAKFLLFHNSCVLSLSCFSVVNIRSFHCSPYFVFVDTLDRLNFHPGAESWQWRVCKVHPRKTSVFPGTFSAPWGRGPVAQRSLSPWSQPRLPHGGGLIPCWRPRPAPRLVLFFLNAKTSFAVISKKSCLQTLKQESLFKF